MTTPAPGERLTRDDTARLGRAMFYVQQQAQAAPTEVIKAKIGTLIAAAKAMDFAVRIHGHESAALTPEVVESFAELAGISHVELLGIHLPMLKRADVVDYSVVDGKIRSLDEFVGLSAPMLQQALMVLEAMDPSAVERAVLHCVEIASWAPLTRDQHLDQLARRGHDSKSADDALKITLALGVNRKVRSVALREDVVFSPHVWSSGQEGVAKFLKGLPSGERDALLGMCEQAANRPGLAIPRYAGFEPTLVASAQKVGLIQTARVKSTADGRAGAQTYVFSPVLDHVDDAYSTTEALHERKLFVAHILYGVEKAQVGRGRIESPLRLVAALVRNGSVGPATNISTDYHLLEARGIVNVRDAGGGRSYLDAVRPEIIEGGLGWLRAAAGAPDSGDVGEEAILGRMRPPHSFSSPEAERAAVGDMGASDEITTAAVLELRKLKGEAQRVARFDYS